MSTDAQPAPRATSVYVHFPWCTRKCPYCDFATVPKASNDIPSAVYADAIERELQWRAEALSRETRSLISVFFGGGTPSLWEPQALARTLASIQQSFREVHSDCEVTVECNPSSVNAGKLRALRDAGVNRVSIGVQSLRDRHLSFLGRLHNRASAIEAVRKAASAMPRVSADLMFGMPSHTEDELRQDIETLLDLGVEHLSVYALTIEPGTPFGAQHRAGTLRVETDDRYAHLYECAESTLTQAGFEHYEVSNYANNGAVSEHNAHYWRGGEYVGLGAAAVGCLDVEQGRARRWKNAVSPARYQSATGLCEAEQEQEWLGATEILREHLMLGLRTAAGVNLRDAAARAGKPLTEGRAAAIQRACDAGNLIRTANELRVPRERWLQLDGIVRDLF